LFVAGGVKVKKEGETQGSRYVTYLKEGDIGYVRISRPDAMNALNETVVAQLNEAFTVAEADAQTKAIILTGEGKAFVAGADIKFFVDCINEGNLPKNYEFTSSAQNLLNRIDDCKKLVIAKMNGLALGGGLELALSADAIVAFPKAVMGFPETSIGIYPGLGGTQRSSRAIGKALAKYLIFTGEIITGTDAHSIGLVDYVFEPEEADQKIDDMIAEGTLQENKHRDSNKLSEKWKKIATLFSDENISDWLSGKYSESEDEFAAGIAKKIDAKAPLALKIASQSIDKGYELPLKEGLKLELAHLNEIFSSEDALMGLTNIGKKNIHFKGK
jgi:enoyl-CoA hydratase / 3-hydroxyacyl-CoA dehydrogenase